MIKYEKIRALKTCNTTQEFIHTFNKIFKETIKEHLSLLEADTMYMLLAEGNYNKIRILLEDMVKKAQRKVLDAVASGKEDDVYNGRYQRLKELEDLITFFINYEVRN